MNGRENEMCKQIQTTARTVCIKFTLMHLGKVWIHFFSTNYKLNSIVDWALLPWLATSLKEQHWIQNCRKVNRKLFHYLSQEQLWQMHSLQILREWKLWRSIITYILKEHGNWDGEIDYKFRGNLYKIDYKKQSIESKLSHKANAKWSEFNHYWLL